MPKESRLIFGIVSYLQFNLIFLTPLSEIFVTSRNIQNARFQRTRTDYEAMVLVQREGCRIFKLACFVTRIVL